jgi:FixJ family two-component response regulator/signal transduction histidine kinase
VKQPEPPSKASAAAFGERLAFERLLADLSARFANVARDGVFAELEAALARLVESLGYDRCTFTEFAADGELHVVCSAATGGIEPLPRGPFLGRPWLVGEIRAGRIIALADMPNGLPPEAVAEAANTRRMGLRSHLSIPLRAGGRVIGALSFGGLRGALEWPEEVITRLTIIGEVFASAVARARSEDEAQQLRGRLWHADRVARTTALTAAIAHELNQPLAAILSNAQAGLRYLEREPVDAGKMREILAAVVRDDKRAADTIRSMRALLRHEEAGRTRVDVAASLRDVLQLLAAELRRQGVRVESELEGDCWVMAAKVQIEQVALNLILNAAAAMQPFPRDERRLRISVFRAADGRVTLAVSDAGVGIVAEHRDAVFEPFWTTRREGLGFGLAICRAIVQAHDGRIAVEPNPDRGVTFRVELRAAAGEPAEAAAPAPEAPQQVVAAPNVCIVDDDAAARASVARLVTAEGWNALSYATATEFLAGAPLGEVACVLLDNLMPDLSGMKLLEQLAGRGGAPPVVLLSGDGDVATSVAAMKLGAVDFLVKPVEGDVLVAAVRKALERHAGERARTREREACRALVDRLSTREREVMEHVIRGRLNKQIAADLNIAEQTVKQHRGRVMEKLEVRSVPELLRVYERSGLFAVPGVPANRADQGA